MRFERILGFSELGDFIYSPLRTYSSGMVARLGFSIATEVDPDILIIDEILSVGDEHFRKKCDERILSFKEKGVTILFVSHSMSDIKRLCDKASAWSMEKSLTEKLRWQIYTRKFQWKKPGVPATPLPLILPPFQGRCGPNS
jgi:ABC-type polysaccharide/polyol phosphate transport system ATPase subunit